MMDSHPYFKPDKGSKYWPLYEAISTYYPLGVPRVYPGPYYEHEGTKKINDLLTARIHNRGNYEKEWIALCNAMSAKLGLPVVSTTLGQAPSLSAYVVLKETHGPAEVVRDELHFAVSLLGPFCTLHEQTTTVRGRNESERQVAVTCVSTSPTEAAVPYYAGVKKLLCNVYGHLKAVPYTIGEQWVDGLWVNYRDEAENRVYHALFNHLLDFRIANTGSSVYGVEDWE